jgi:hypothetical protein
VARFGRFTDAYVQINGVDLSDDARALNFTQSRRSIDNTTFGTNDAIRTIPGPKEYALSVEFLQDFAAGSVHRTLQPLYESGSTFAFIWRPDSAAVGADNPEFSGSAWITDYPLGGAHGDNLSSAVTFGVDGAFTESVA